MLTLLNFNVPVESVCPDDESESEDETMSCDDVEGQLVTFQLCD